MRLNNSLFSILLTGLLFASCKKESTSSNPDTASTDANGNLAIDNAADGACYAIITRTFISNSGDSHYDDIQSAFAWFGKQQPVTFKDAGTVSANSFELTNIGGINYYQYIGFDELFPSNAVNWSIAGNSTSGIAAFDHTDNTAFPTGPNFNLPATIDINSSFTITHTPVSNVAGIVYSVLGNLGRKNKAVKNGGSSVTFTSAEMKEVALANDGIAFSIMPVVFTTATINGKKYYFVKQTQYERETKTL